MSYYHAKKVQLAKEYLANRELQERERQRRDDKLERSRAWLEAFLAQPRNSRLNWAPRWPITKDISKHAREIIEREKPRREEALGESPQEAASCIRAEAHTASGANQPCDEAASCEAQSAQGKTFETPF